MSKYEYLEVFQSPFNFEITRVDLAEFANGVGQGDEQDKQLHVLQCAWQPKVRPRRLTKVLPLGKDKLLIHAVFFCLVLDRFS